MLLLDRTSRLVLNYVREKAPHIDDGICDLYNLIEDINLHEDDVRDAIDILCESDLIAKTNCSNGHYYGIRLKLRSKHRVEFSLIDLAHYIKRQWIAITALALSLISLSVSLL